jgi:hypothetical protein
LPARHVAIRGCVRLLSVLPSLAAAAQRNPAAAALSGPAEALAKLGGVANSPAEKISKRREAGARGAP